MKDNISIRTTGTETDENVQPDELQDGLQPEEVQPGENLSGGQSSSPRRYRLYAQHLVGAVIVSRVTWYTPV